LITTRLSKEKIKEIEKQANLAYGINYIDAVNVLIGHIETLDIEINQYRAEIERLRQLVDEKAKDERRMFESSERLQDNVVQLNKELQEAKAAKKVPLPREVADALAKAMKDDANIDYLAWQLARDGSDYDSEHMKMLKERAATHSFIDLVDALRYGYTVEETPWEKFQHGVRELLEEYGITVKTARGTSPIGFAKKIDELYESIFGKKASG